MAVLRTCSLTYYTTIMLKSDLHCSRDNLHIHMHTTRVGCGTPGEAHWPLTFVRSTGLLAQY